MADQWTEDHLRRSVALIIATVIVFVVLGTGIYGDPIQQSVIQGVGFGILYSIASILYREYVRDRIR